MAIQTPVGPARSLHLNRAARVAGEAFAFAEPEALKGSNRLNGVAILAVAIGLAAALTLIALL